MSDGTATEGVGRAVRGAQSPVAAQGNDGGLAAAPESQADAALAAAGVTEVRSADAILARIEGFGSQDILGFRTEALAQFLTFDECKPLLKPDATPWGASDDTPRTREGVLKVMRDYMGFAWTKANNERGISASRSIDKFGEWLWMLGDESTIAAFEAAPYAMYGKPQLRVICDAYGFEVVSR